MIMEVREGRLGFNGVAIYLVLLFYFGTHVEESASSLVDQPCNIWGNSNYFRGVCWKFVEHTTACQDDHPIAQQGVPRDQTAIRFLNTLRSEGSDTVVMSVFTNITDTSNGEIAVYDGPSLLLDVNCTGLNLTTGVEEWMSCTHTADILCFIDVGNPCSSNGRVGDLLGSTCYFRGSQKRTWGQSQSDCDAEGGYLVETIDNTLEGFISGIMSLLNMSDPVWFGAKRNTSHVNSWYSWVNAEFVVDGDVVPTNDSCMAAAIEGTTLAYTSMPCNPGEYDYICQDAAPIYEYYIAIPEVIQTADTRNTAYIAMSTSARMVTAAIDVYIDGTLANTTGLIIYRKFPYKYNITRIDELLLTNIDIYTRAIHIITNGVSDVSLIYTSSSNNGNTLTSADVTIYPSLFLESYYVVTNARMNDAVNGSMTQKAFITVMAIGEGNTSVDLYLARRYFDIRINYNGIDLINTPELHFKIGRFQSVLIESEDDLIGATVTSNQPVAVYSGNKKAQVAETCCPNYVMTHIIPHRHTSNEYLLAVPTGVYGGQVVLRMTATTKYDEIYHHDENTLTLKGSYYFLRVGKTHDILLDSGTFHRFWSASPFMLSVSGSYSTDSDASKPCLVPIPAMHLYRYHYVFNPRVLLDSWTDLCLSVIGKNINITNTGSLSINSLSVQDYIDTESSQIQSEIYGEIHNGSKAIVLKFRNIDYEIVFESINRESHFFIIMNWNTSSSTFCRVLGIDIEADPDLYSGGAALNFAEWVSAYKSNIIFDPNVSSGSWSTGSSSSGSSGSSSSGGSSGNSSSSSGNTATTNTDGSGNMSTDITTISSSTTESGSANGTTSDECLAIPKLHNLTDSEIENLVKDIQKRLFVDPKDVSAYSRKYISASDPRPSSTTMGVFGIAIFSFMVVALLIPDAITFTLFVIKWAKIFKKKYYG